MAVMDYPHQIYQGMQEPQPVIISQPEPYDPFAEINCPITVRKMTIDDSEFAAGMEVESFRGKFEWAVGKSRVERVIEFNSDQYKQSSQVYERSFIACYEGRPAGLIALQIKNDPEVGSGGCCNMCCKLGCIASCGLCCMHCVLNEPVEHTGECYINHICVDSNYRGKGIGKFLLQYGESEAKRLGCTRMTLYVAETNRAKNLYERQGYVVTNNEDGWLFTYCAVGVRRWCKMDKVIQ